MDNENLNNQDNWLNELLATPEQGSELTADDSALDSHGMSQLSDMELQQIIQEAMSEEWDLNEYAPDPDATPYLDEEYQDTADTMMQDEAYADAYEQDSAEDPDAPVRKVRPKRKKNSYGLFGLPHLASTIIWVLIVAIAGISFGRLLWVCAADVLAFGRQDQEISVSITETDDLNSIAQKLYDAGLIKYPQLFKLYGSISNAEKKIEVGTYTLNTLFDYHALVGAMQSSSLKERVEVIIPEGYSCAQIFALLEKKGVCTAEALENYAMTSQFSSYWFLEDIPRGNKYCLEGFLFPDTYEFYVGDEPQRVYSILLARFEDRCGEDLNTYLESLNKTLAKKLKSNGFSDSYIEEHAMRVYDVITIASIIQKESADSGENYNVSSVLYNRLTNPSKFPHLESNATVVYAVGGRTELTPEDYTLDSPYNTFVVEGLPAGPISNPGYSSVLSALSPADTKYYYFALDYVLNENQFFETKSAWQNFVDSLE